MSTGQEVPYTAVNEREVCMPENKKTSSIDCGNVTSFVINANDNNAPLGRDRTRPQ